MTIRVVSPESSDITSNYGYIEEPDENGNYEFLHHPSAKNETSEVTSYYIETNYHGAINRQYYKPDEKIKLTASDILISCSLLTTSSDASNTVTITIPSRCTATLSDPESRCSYGFVDASFSPSSISGGTTNVTMSVNYKKAPLDATQHYFTYTGKSIKVTCRASINSNYTGSASNETIVFSLL